MPGRSRKNETHDWKTIMRHDDHHLYDDIDIKSAGSANFWVGAISGIVLTISLCLLLGLYFNGWQLP